MVSVLVELKMKSKQDTPSKDLFAIKTQANFSPLSYCHIIENGLLIVFCLFRMSVEVLA